MAATALCFATATAAPVMAQGIGHSVFMRGQIISLNGKQAVLCIGKADGATASQVLDVYRVSQRPGPSKGSPTFTRTKVGTVTIDHVFDDHFAHATVTEGRVGRNDIVELHRAG
ncbi:MAG: hypothetical protein DI540_21655 [Sphingobium sp.]|nr:MAG: hypothetical protein DI540_21655 [Sphingobium sp.]